MSSIIKAIDKEYGYKIRGHEIHQTRSVMGMTSLKERVDKVSRFCSRNELDHLAYHAPILGRGQNIWEDAWNDKVRKSLALTIEEAASVRQEAGISGRITVVFHLTSYLHANKLPRTMEEKLQLFKAAESEFLQFAGNRLSNDCGGCILAVENVYPRKDNDFANIGPFHPQELVRMKEYGIKTALDIAHYQLYSNYLEYGKNNAMGDLDKETYSQAPSWKQCIDILSESLVLLHISDAKGFTLEGEALPLGKGEVPLHQVLREAGTGRTLQGTLELTGGHLDNGRLQGEGARWLLHNARDVFFA